MKLTKAITFFLAAGALASLSAQQPADMGTTLDVAAQPKNSKTLYPLRLLQPAAVAKNAVRYVVLVRDQDPTPRDGSTKDFKVFMIMTPPDLAEAQRSYSEGNLNAAKRQLAAVRTKYADFAGLPDSPAVKAGLLELRCLARLQDWSGLSKAVEAFPWPKLQDAADRAVLGAARLLSQVSDDPATAAARQKEIASFLADTGKMKHLHSTEYGWLKYAQGRALESAAADGNSASQAVDAYCEAAVCYRGGEMELATDAMKRAFHLLWGMPGVKAYGTSAKKMDIKKWNEAPANFRDAVAMANMLVSIIDPEIKDDAIRQAAGYFVNAQEGKRPASAEPAASK